mgnify:CR=1 FL=1
MVRAGVFLGLMLYMAIGAGAEVPGARIVARDRLTVR